MRTYLNKFAVQVGITTENPMVKALHELINNGYVVKIDTYFNTEVGVWADVYLLTPKGTALVEQHNIVAISP